MISKGPIVSVLLLLFLDGFLIILVFLPVVIFHRAQPFSRGFYCDDQTISHPYLTNTVPTWLMLLLSLGLPAVFGLITEMILYTQLHGDPRLNSFFAPYQLGRINIPSIINRFCSAAVHFLAGLALVLSFTNMGKIVIGRLRPHFFDACKPDWGNVTCTSEVRVGSGAVFTKSLYVTNFTCTETNPYMVRDALQSFPSGHSSISFYAAVFTVLYIEYRVHWYALEFFRMFLQALFLMLATYCALSRVSDYKHHPSDVLAGSILGIGIAIYEVIVVWKLPVLYHSIEKRIRRTEEKDQDIPLKYPDIFDNVME